MKFKKLLFHLAYYLVFIALGVALELIVFHVFGDISIHICSIIVIAPMVILRPFFTDWLDKRYAPPIPAELQELHETIARRYAEKLQLGEEAKKLLGGSYIHRFMRDFEQVVFDFSLYGKAGILTHGTFTRVMTLTLPYSSETHENTLRFINKITLLAEKDKHLIFAGCILAPLKKETTVCLYYEPKYYFSVCKRLEKLFSSERQGKPCMETAQDKGWTFYQTRLLPPPNELWYLLNIRSSVYLEHQGFDLSTETEAVIFMTFPNGNRDFLAQAERYGFSLFHETKKDDRTVFALTRKMCFDTDSLDRMTDFLLYLAGTYHGSFDEYEVFTDDFREEILEYGI
ncbi:MAG: hypothetical protein IJ489_01540 [Clostridia bacterium]|nr:hypothetical protein [Clostridia bacterium]